MRTSVLLSIKPEFSEAILDGRKTYELRRRIFGRRDVGRCVIYSSSPVRRVVGEFTVEKVLALAPPKLWAATLAGSAVERRLFDAYFQGRDIGFALKIGAARRFARPQRLREYCGLRRPPQSFCYLERARKRLAPVRRPVRVNARLTLWYSLPKQSSRTPGHWSADYRHGPSWRICQFADPKCYPRLRGPHRKIASQPSWEV